MISIIAVDFECALGGAGAILSSESAVSSVTVVPGTIEILHLVVVKVSVHRDDPDVLAGIFIVNNEISGIFLL